MCFMKRNSPYLRNKREFHIFLFQGKVKLSTDLTLHLIHLIINPSMQKFSKQLLINYKQPTSHFNSLFGKKNQHLIFWLIQHYYKLSTQKKGQEKKMSSSNRRSSVFTSWPREQRLKPFSTLMR